VHLVVAPEPERRRRSCECGVRARSSIGKAVRKRCPALERDRPFAELGSESGNLALEGEAIGVERRVGDAAERRQSLATKQPPLRRARDPQRG